MGKRTIETKYQKYTEEELCNEIKRFVKEFGKVPIGKDLEKLDGYPSRKTFTNIFGSLNEAIRKSGFEPSKLNSKEYSKKYKNKEYLSKIICDYIEKYNKIPKLIDICKEHSHTLKLLYKEVYGSWNKALEELNLPINQIYQYNDLFLESEFHRFVKENGRIPSFREFNSSQYPSFWCYQNRFGSWNNAVKAYGYETQSDIYSFEELSKQLIDFCTKIKNKENRNIVLVKEIEECKDIASYSSFRKHLKNNGYSLKSFLNEYGFDILNEGSGLNHTFPDGEKTKSSYEYIFTNYLKNDLCLKYNSDYFRDIKYKNFISNYNGMMNCDYIINLDNRVIYIEIAGILKEYKQWYLKNKIISSSKSKEKYRLKLMEKEKMLKENNLEYYILFPSDLQEDFLMQIFKGEDEWREQQYITG